MGISNSTLSSGPHRWTIISRAIVTYLALSHQVVGTKHHHAREAQGTFAFDDTTRQDMDNLVVAFANEATAFKHVMAIIDRAYGEINGNNTTADAHDLATRSVDDMDLERNFTRTSDRNDIGQIFQDKFYTDDPKEAFEKLESAHPYEYWSRTPTTEQAAGNINFFADFLEDYKTNDTFGCKLRELSAMSCFAYNFWGETDFTCGITSTAQCQKPDPTRVMKHVNNHWNSYTTAAKVDLSRKILFTSQSFQSHLWDFVTLHVSTSWSSSKSNAELMVCCRRSWASSTVML
jgi:hypothetical protein